jgi:hypothetical protein
MQFKIYIFQSLLLSFLAYIFVSESAIVRAQSLQTDSLLQRSVSVRMYDVYASQVLEFLATEYQFPAGIEIESSDNVADKDKRISIYVFQKPLEFALNEIVRANPRYRWELNEGVVNLLPKEASESLVEIKIEKFEAINMKRIDVRKAIGDIPELGEKLKSLGLEFTTISVWPNKDKRDTMILTVDIKDTTLKSVLNEIAKKTGYWSASRFSGYFFVSI